MNMTRAEAIAVLENIVMHGVGTDHAFVTPQQEAALLEALTALRTEGPAVEWRPGDGAFGAHNLLAVVGGRTIGVCRPHGAHPLGYQAARHFPMVVPDGADQAAVYDTQHETMEKAQEALATDFRDFQAVGLPPAFGEEDRAELLTISERLAGAGYGDDCFAKTGDIHGEYESIPPGSAGEDAYTLRRLAASRAPQTAPAPSASGAGAKLREVIDDETLAFMESNARAAKERTETANDFVWTAIEDVHKLVAEVRNLRALADSPAGRFAAACAKWITENQESYLEMDTRIRAGLENNRSGAALCADLLKQGAWAALLYGLLYDRKGKDGGE